MPSSWGTLTSPTLVGPDGQTYTVAGPMGSGPIVNTKTGQAYNTDPIYESGPPTGWVSNQEGGGQWQPSIIGYRDPAPGGLQFGGWQDIQTYDPHPGTTLLENFIKYGTMAAGAYTLGAGALAGAGAGAGAGAAAAPGTLLPEAGAGLGSVTGLAEAGGGSMFDFITQAFSGLSDLGSGIGNFISNAFGLGPVGPEQVGIGFPLASEAGAGLTDATVAGAGGGIENFFSNAFNNFGTNFSKNPLSTLSNLASTIQAFSSVGDVRAAGQDPLGPFRASAAGQLNNLMLNPSLVTQYPGYQAGLEGVLRGSAAAGYTASGNELAALQKYGGQFYNDEIARLAKLAGFEFSPVQLTAGQQEAEQQATNLIARALGNLGFMFRPQGQFANAGAR